MFSPGSTCAGGCSEPARRPSCPVGARFIAPVGRGAPQSTGAITGNGRRAGNMTAVDKDRTAASWARFIAPLHGLIRLGREERRLGQVEVATNAHPVARVVRQT